MKILQRFIVGSIGGERLPALEVEEAAVHLGGARFGDNVHHATGGAPELRSGAAGHPLEFLDCIQGDVNGCALPTGLLTEKAVVVVAAIKAHVVEDAALAGEADFVAVRALYNGHARGEREQIFKFSSQHRCRADSNFIERCAGYAFCGLNRWSVRYLDGFADGRDLDGELK